ncbi:MAG TPA: ATP-binding protein [Armatimonadota bacterium]|nr:ATP-binding protein [Armatimonadota bacterium]
MLDDSNLSSLMLDLESDRVERKASLSDRDRIRQAICAYANDLPNSGAPGYIFIGANDDGSCASLAVDDQLLLTLAQMRDDGQIMPFPMVEVQSKTLNGCPVAVVEVHPSYNPPVRYNGRVWIRVGPRRAQATPDEERRLTEKRRAGNLPFDQHPVIGASREDLDLDYFQNKYLPAAVAPDVLAENQRSLDDQLSALHFLTRDGRPNYGAILCFGRDPIRWIPGAYIQFLRFDGSTLTDPISRQKEIRGPVPDAIPQLDEVMDANIAISSDIRNGTTEIKHADFPFVAMQQLCRNAVLHRCYESTNAPVQVYWFSDRIEIHNPGGLFGRVNPENFGQPAVTDYRNPLLAEIMKNLGFVQRFGTGIPIVRKELEKNGNPPPNFIFSDPSRVVVIVKART